MPRGLQIGAAIAQGLEQGTSNLFTIMEKKKDRKREDELFALQKKQIDLQIKELELGDADPDTIRLKKEKLKADVALQKAKAGEADIALEDARKTTTQRLQEFKDQVNAIRTYDQGKQDALALPGTAPAAGDAGVGLGLPAGWSVELETGEDPKLKYKTPKEKELTAQQQLETEATQRSAESWVAGAEPLRDTKGTVISETPRTQEEAYWGLMSMGQDPESFDFSHLPLQEEMGKPRPWRKFEKKPVIPGAAGEYTPEQEQLIQDNMTHYNKSREEIIEALRAKGQLK